MVQMIVQHFVNHVWTILGSVFNIFIQQIFEH